jgi:hypothetical protein
VTVRSKAFPVRIDDQQGQVLYIAYFVLGDNAQFIQRIKTTGSPSNSYIYVVYHDLIFNDVVLAKLPDRLPGTCFRGWGTQA